jgi:acyl-CoA thioesterase FadM
MIGRWWKEDFVDGVCAGFEIERRENRKRVCDGHSGYALVTLAEGRATPRPDDIRGRFAI